MIRQEIMIRIRKRIEKIGLNKRKDKERDRRKNKSKDKGRDKGK